MGCALFEASEDWGVRLRLDALEGGMRFGDVFTGDFPSGTDEAPIKSEARGRVNIRNQKADLGPPQSPTLCRRKCCPEKHRVEMAELYQRNSKLNNTMASRPSLAPPAIPQYLVNQHQQFTDSNGSIDSVATQVAVSFHGDLYQGQGTGFMAGQYPQVAAHGMYNNFSMQGPPSILNPDSAPFAPSIQSRDGSINGVASYNNQRTDSGYASYYQQTPIEPSNYNPYGSGPYADGNMAPGSSNYGIQPSHFQGNPQGAQDPYSDSTYTATPAFREERQTYGDSQQYRASSPTMSYAPGLSGPPSSYSGPGPAYQNMAYAPSNQYGTQAFDQGITMPMRGYGNGYNNSHAGQASNNRYPQPEHENRSRSAWDPRFGNSYSDSSNPASFQACNGQAHNQNRINSVTFQQGPTTSGEVQPPSQSTTRDTSPEKSTDRSTHASSEEPHSHLSEIQLEGGKSRYSSQQSRPDRGTDQTPVLRSARGKTITSAPVPSREITSNWVGSVPLTNFEESTGKNIRSPPKMKSLVASSGISGRPLIPVTGNDPFAVQPNPNRGQSYNPFITSTQISPYNNHDQAQPQKMSQALYALTKNGKPSFVDATNNLPFVEYCRMAETNNFGVIKIKNIPYSVERAEVFAFLGRNARVINEMEYEPVHIVMERVTSKTLDCFVEFINFNEAVNAVNRFETNRDGGRGGRLGPRHVEVELSSQEELMKELFPKTKNVLWKGCRPTIIPRDFHDKYNSGFQGFVTKEELVMLLKHVEAPQRSPFSKECPERPFECLISTLLKFPWQMVDYITIADREQIHKVTVNLLQILKERVEYNEDRKINPVLYKRVWRAALKCQGFSPAQKDDIIFIVGLPQEMALEFGLPEYAACWKTLWTIGPKAGYPSDLVNYYAAIIREYTDPKKELSLAERAAQGPQRRNDDHIFGNLAQYTAYPRYSEFMRMTLAQVAVIEWEGIEKVLREFLTRKLQQ